ncbi:ubiquinone biosynthesis monooxygenase COQ7 [Ceratobasidium sp. AG-Ba]|nr:ubiquinone biosynthesis monooxygenase COQ7 [Ceratobasidium sp. AG-Ba]QRW14421.1 ubiquinone biosynthesis monooxygenase COQ7 [Ceratobasidium sp. AG-Ba]
MALVLRSARRALVTETCLFSATRPTRVYSSKSTRQKLASSAYTDQTSSFSQATHETPSDLTRPQREALEAALRVDQAGEVAANYIYMGQIAVLGRDPRLGPLIQDMWDQEKKHLAVMNALQTQHRVQPTLLHGVAQVAGWGLGAATALMGKEAAMACTEAVETVIGEHYDDQLSDLDKVKSEHPSLPLLKSVIREFRDDELEHLDTAVEHHSQRAPAHALLTAVVEAGCKVAIELCKRV